MGINFLNVSEEDFEGKIYILFQRFSRAKVIPNTRDLHAFIPIKMSTTSLTDDHQVCFIREEYKRLYVKLKDYVACVNDSQWRLGRVEDISADQSPNTSFNLTSIYKVWIKEDHILRVSPI
ncbi:hypothetical protein PR048_006741 [Dryococelus australis]|uniref:Uncharacterized protein n=1 Tax=Dryococelus australis TaxID=614101 RepID=A0ABQ9IBU6_9NEOP|nr:hypothetical protein PR048_006741 [Dryococelus australis]